MNKILEEDIDKFANEFKLGDKLNGKTILVTGATGLLGSCMVRCLLALNKMKFFNVNIISVVRNIQKAESLFGKESDCHKFYIYDFSSNKEFRPNYVIDYIIHFASPTASKYFIENPAETATTILHGTERILNFAKQQPVESLIYVSSLEVYGTILDDSKTIKENESGYINTLSTRSSYPLAKRMSECLCHAYASEYNMPIKIARLAQTFGAGVDTNDNRVFAQFAKSIINHEDIILNTHGTLSRCYCYTTDAINGILYIMLRGDNGNAYNVANPNSYISIKDMADFICAEFGNGEKVIMQLKDGMGYSPITKLRLSTTAISNLGWIPQYNLKTMFYRLIESLKIDLNKHGI